MEAERQTWLAKKLTRSDMRAITKATRSGLLSQMPWTDIRIGRSPGRSSRAIGTAVCVEVMRCPLLVHSGHPQLHRTCPLLGVKRTSLVATHMSAFDPSGHQV